MNVIPSRTIWSTRLCTIFFSNLKSGIPNRKRPPILSFFSYTVTLWPALFSCCAEANPAGPDPTTTTFLPVRVSGGEELIQPSRHPLSTISFSIYSMVTGSSFMLSTHDASQGAGHILPVNSGKLLVECSSFKASSHLPL